MSRWMEQKQIFAGPNTTTAPFALSMNKNSQIISKKMKPRIRIIHLFAPEIIEIDAANFREEVQRLTGKPADDQNTCKGSRVSRNLLLQEPNISSANKRKLEVASMRAGVLDDHDGIKGEGEIWKEAYSGGGFLGRFSEIEYDFMQEIHKLTYVESTTRMDAYGPGSNPN